MKEIKIESTLQLYEDLESLPKHVQNLFQRSFQARDKAYAPYSHFSVGAAILLGNGEIIVGNNQENACYPSGLCAERTAIYAAGANFPDSVIRTMVISAKSKESTLHQPAPPCGACRQAIAEYEYKQQKPIEIYFMGETGSIARSHSLANLLPLVFDNSYL